ncbi:MAG: 4-hydroxybenzoate polyprenyltransferase [Clostridiales bacterium]|jgi:4-hydroxybenzoate polyprenyltransferase|nr:4-hydroxybenzoate polyprenyltransferase [Clostridiales bacterium]
MESMAEKRFFKKIYDKIHQYGELVMFSHTLFSLPFAMIAMFLAADGMPSLRIFFWIMVCLFAGRNGANALNRLVDRKYDAMNPRTADRHMPRGVVKPYEVLLITGFAYAVFVFAAYQINWICFVLSPVALALFTLYSFTKRFTWLCHIILGITCAGAPVGAWLAVTGTFALPPLILAAIVTLWVGGFDIVYGTQDIDFDKSVHLHSVPERFGLKHALLIAKGMHLIMWLLLWSLVFLTQLSWVYAVGVAVSGFLLAVEHGIVDPAHRKKMNFAAYHINQIISVMLFLAAAVDVFLI